MKSLICENDFLKCVINYFLMSDIPNNHIDLSQFLLILFNDLFTK